MPLPLGWTIPARDEGPGKGPCRDRRAGLSYGTSAPCRPRWSRGSAARSMPPLGPAVAEGPTPLISGGQRDENAADRRYQTIGW